MIMNKSHLAIDSAMIPHQKAQKDLQHLAPCATQLTHRLHDVFQRFLVHASMYISLFDLLYLPDTKLQEIARRDSTQSKDVRSI